MTDKADSVGELGTTRGRITDCRAIEKSPTVEVEQPLLGVARFAVDELCELACGGYAAADEEPKASAIGHWESTWIHV